MNATHRTTLWHLVGLLSAGVWLAGCAHTAPTGTGFEAFQGGDVTGVAHREANADLMGRGAGVVHGEAFGAAMHTHDRARLHEVYANTPNNQSSTWVNPHTRRRYRVTPRVTTYDAVGRPCRQAEMVATLEGRSESAVTLACRRPDGAWGL